MDYNGGTELWAHQWGQIRDPQNIWFAWAQEEEEGEMVDQNMSAESIKLVLESIRKANKNKDEFLDLTSYMLSRGTTTDLKLGDFTLDYIIINISKGKNTNNGENTFPFNPLIVKPSVINREVIETPIGLTGDFVRYVFYIQDKNTTPPLNVEYIDTEEIGIEIIVKKNKSIDVEEYLFASILGPLKTNEYRGYSLGVFSPASATYGCDRVDSRYNCNDIAGRRPHHGVDLVGSIGDDCYSIIDGIVTFAGTLTGYGKSVAIRGNIRNRITGAEEQLYLLYSHLNSINVTKGQQVERRDIIGQVGISGADFLLNYPNEVHLHFEVLDTWWPSGFDERRNPAEYIVIDNAQP